MRQRVIPTLIGAISVAVMSLSLAAKTQPSWRTWKQNEQLSVQFHTTETGVYAIKADVFVANATSSQFISLLHNTQHASDWLEGVKEVQLLDTPQPHYSKVFTLFNSPWPVADRELYTLSCYERIDSTKKQLVISSVDSSNAVGSGRVRIEELTASWTLTEQQDGLLLAYQVSADPGGAVPHWISNKVALKSVYKTLSNLRERLTQSQVVSPLPLSTGDCHAFRQRYLGGPS